MNRRRVQVAAAVLATVALAGGVGLRGLVGPAGEPARSASLRLACVPGETAVYTFAYASHGVLSDPAFGLAGAQRGPERVDVEARGTVREACLKSDDGSWEVAMTFDHVEGSFRSTSSPEQRAETLLGGTTFVEMGKDGHVGAIRFPGEMGTVGRNVARDVLAQRSVRVVDTARNDEAWTREEADLQGPYRASYTASIARDGTAIVTKHRDAYVRGSGAIRGGGEQEARFVAPQDTVLHIDPSAHRLVSVEANVGTEVGPAKKPIASTRTSLRLHFERVDATADAPALLAARGSLGDTAPGDLVGTDIDRRLDEKMHRDTLGNDTWKTLAPRLDGPEVASVQTFVKLRALFATSPEACEAAADRLVHAKSARGEDFLTLARALTSAGTPAAQRALVRAAAGNRGDSDKELGLLAQLALVERPTREAEESLRSRARTADTAGKTAGLALASIARTVRATDPERAAHIDAEVRSSLAEATTPESRRSALLRVGNAGLPDVLAEVREALEDESTPVRRAAAGSLRFVEAPEAEELLAAVVQNDGSERVRAEAVDALGYRKLTAPTMTVLQRRVVADRSESVRLGLVRVLGTEAERYPDVLAVLRTVAENDAASSVRQAAALALARLEGVGL